MILPAGIHPNVPAEAYHADPCEAPSLSSSVAAEIVARSPLHGWASHPRLNPDFEPEEARQLDLGSVAHELLLGRGRGIAVLDFPDWRTKAAKEARDEARASGKTPILQAQFDHASKMVAAAHRQLKAVQGCHEFFGEQGRAELVLVWAIGGLWYRAMLDWISADGRTVLDFKSTTNANPEHLGRKIAAEHLDLRASHYMRGLDMLDAPRAGRRKFFWVFQEVAPPYGLAVVERTAVFAGMGDRKLTAADYAWRDGMTKNRWPGYPPIVHQPDYPPYLENTWLDREVRDNERRVAADATLAAMLENSPDAPPGYRYEGRR